MHGILLKRLGHNVRILEQASSSDREGQAAGITVAPEMSNFFRQHDRSGEQFAIRCSGFQRFFRDLQHKEERDVELKVTSWKVLYYRPRANFDGLESTFCKEPPGALETDGGACYDLMKKVTDVAYRDGSVIVTFNDLSTGISESVRADLMIAADGSSSATR